VDLVVFGMVFDVVFVWYGGFVFCFFDGYGYDLGL